MIAFLLQTAAASPAVPGGPAEIPLSPDNPAASILAAWFLAGLFLDFLALGYLLRRGLPRPRVSPPPWPPEEIAPVSLALFALMFLSSGLASAAGRLPGLEGADSETVAMLIHGILFQAAGVAVILLRLRTWGASPRGIFGLNARSVIVALIAGPLVLLAVSPVVDLTQLAVPRIMLRFGLEPRPQEIPVEFLETESPWVTGIVIVFAVAVAPVMEELFFRGFLYRSLRRPIGILPAAVLSSAIFASFHLNLAAAPGLFLLGMGLILGFELTGTLGTAIVIHAMFNARSLLLMLLLRDTMAS